VWMRAAILIFDPLLLLASQDDDGVVVEGSKQGEVIVSTERMKHARSRWFALIVEHVYLRPRKQAGRGSGDAKRVRSVLERRIDGMVLNGECLPLGLVAAAHRSSGSDA
jgi:hypothetical protein